MKEDDLVRRERYAELHLGPGKAQWYKEKWEAAREVLKKVEWVEDRCPCCRGWEPHEVNSGMVVIGHAPDCGLKAALEDE